ncbi:kinase-like protein [Aspergillus neoniger CBS 115656]|uniref:Kinase-like protein n=1 Tax=Aspergillus neoniger (strain CBS 115656) TaxID=1448310 RepID=A0A318YK76_ASPNB|nr:kinase-like protein [Aspergillus neoniger CBS 115656]PYH34739.1 kinase-like protein [Aspergillus neoniger CBS 115656]
MLHFTNPFRWRVWTSLWVLLSHFSIGINLFQSQPKETARPDFGDDDGSDNIAESSKETPNVIFDHLHTDQQAKCNKKIVHLKQPPNFIAMGYSGYICKADQDTIIKHPRYLLDNELYNEMYRDMISTEKEIYERLGNHKGIIPYLGVHDQSTGAIKLAYAQQGDLETYIGNHDKPSEAIRASWIQSIVETFWHIYSCKFLHQDVKPNNILVHNDSPKVADFGNAEIYALDADMEAIYMEELFPRVDILGIGCIIYSIAAWRAFWKCWSNSYENMQSLYEDFNASTGTDLPFSKEE